MFSRSLLFVISLLAAGCSRDVASQGSSRTTAVPAESYPLRGVITGLLPEQSSLMVKHEDIPGFMPAMTMALKVEAGVLTTAAKGQSVAATLYKRGDEFWLRDVKLSNPPATAAASPPASAPATGDAEAGKTVYARVCFACHQLTGLGLPGAFPPLAGAEPVAGSPERLIRIVLHGLQGPITVKGATYTNVMPPHGPQLKDQEIADVLTYVRGAWGNAAAGVTVEAVSRLRATEKDRTTMWTWAELEKLPP